ncbi:MAG: hypothetical protein M3275_06185 [Thermoproteota archaeon]|nr:hypothetical protein [Thermoproteota archaeon]
MTIVDPLPPLSEQQPFVTENIFRCLAPCQDCTGQYISQLLRKRLICNCTCHMKRKGNNNIDSDILQAKAMNS